MNIGKRRTEAKIDQMIGNRWIELEDKGWEEEWKENGKEERKKSIGQRMGIGEEKKRKRR